MTNKTGIWIDKKVAYLIRFENNEAKVQAINSEIEDFHPKGGSRSKVPYGPMGKISESKLLERKKHQSQAYFREIMEQLSPEDQLYIFGPAETKNKLREAIQSSSRIANTVWEVQPADKMTEGQMVAQVRDFFSDKTV